MKTVKGRPWLFVALAYGWAWLFWIPVALTRMDYQQSPLLVAVILLGVFGPGVAGIVLTYRDGDREKIRDFWQRALDPRRIQWGWLAFMLVLWPALHLAANLFAQAAGSPAPASALVAQMTAQPSFILVVVVLYFLQAWLEDLGWRGYMGEQLLRSWSPGWTAAVVGIVHAFWHLPLFFVMGTNQMKMGMGFEFWLFVTQAVAFSFYATWCYVDNGRSTLAAILLHTLGNLSNDIFTLQGGTLKLPLYTVLMLLGAVIIHVLMSRGREALEPGAFGRDVLP